MVQLPVPVKNWYVPLFDTNLPRPITQALPCFVTQYVDFFFCMTSRMMCTHLEMF